MSNVLNRITKEYLISVNTPDYSIEEWVINPKMLSCDKKYIIIEDDDVREMTQIEKDELKATEDVIKALEEAKIEEERIKAQEEAEQIAIDDKNKFTALSIDEKIEYLYDRR